jgi:hypothetical protein
MSDNQPSWKDLLLGFLQKKKPKVNNNPRSYEQILIVADNNSGLTREDIEHCLDKPKRKE